MTTTTAERKMWQRGQTNVAQLQMRLVFLLLLLRLLLHVSCGA